MPPTTILGLAEAGGRVTRKEIAEKGRKAGFSEKLLDTAVAIFQTKLIREVYRKELDAKTGASLTYMLNSLRATLESSDLEGRVAQLEARAQTGPGGVLRAAP